MIVRLPVFLEQVSDDVGFPTVVDVDQIARIPVGLVHDPVVGEERYNVSAKKSNMMFYFPGPEPCTLRFRVQRARGERGEKSHDLDKICNK